MPLGKPSSESSHSGNVVQLQRMPAAMAAPEMSSARSRLRTTMALSASAQGASVKPQLPMTTLVMPCQQERRAERVPEDLRVHVGVAVDEAGGDDQAVGVDDLARALADAPDGGDAAVAHGDVGAMARQAGAVDQHAVLDQQVVGHQSAFSIVSASLTSNLPGCSTLTALTTPLSTSIE